MAGSLAQNFSRRNIYCTKTDSYVLCYTAKQFVTMQLDGRSGAPRAPAITVIMSSGAPVARAGSSWAYVLTDRLLSEPEAGVLLKVKPHRFPVTSRETSR